MPKLGIIGAMDLEVDALKAHMTDVTVTRQASMDFHEGQLCGVSAVVVRCGIGKVNAALCVQILADLFHVTHVINTGIAGALARDLNIGDILISRDAVHHDVDVQVFGYAPGEVPQLGITAFPADEDLICLAEKACAGLRPAVFFRTGRVVSGDQFISDAAVKARLIQVFQGDCTEMEGAAIAQSAWLNGLPFLILRAVSDNADGSAQVDYPTFERQAAARCAALVEALAETL